MKEKFPASSRRNLHGSGAVVVHRFGDPDGGFAHFPAQFLVQGRRGGSSRNLVLPLHRTFPFAEMDHVSVLVGQDLKFDVPRFPDEFFNEHIRIVEGFFRFLGGQVEHPFDVLVPFHHAHATASASGSRLENHGVTDVIGDLPGFIRAIHGTRAATQQGDVVFRRQLFGDGLVPHPVNGVGGGADEIDALFFAAAGEYRVLRQKSVAGMDGIHAVALGAADDPFDVQKFRRVGEAFGEIDDFVRFIQVPGSRFLARFDGKGADAQFSGSPHDPDGNLAPVGNEYAVDLHEA
ncbi:MAG: hypothetical protein R2751_01875 [Bacteroidales bacterium]